MKRKFNKCIIVFLASILVSCFAFSGTATQVFASTNGEVSGSLKLSFKISKSNSNAARSWINTNLVSTRKDLENRILKEKNKTQKENQEKLLSQRKKTNVSDFFKNNSDGSSLLISKLPFVTVKIGNASTISDANGNFSIIGLKVGQYPLILSYQNHEIYKSTIKISNLSKKLQIVINRSDTDIVTAADKMSKNMDTSKDMNMSKNMDMSMDMIQSSAENTEIEPLLSSNIITFPTYAVGSSVPWALGKGHMVIVHSGNIASCNKADTPSSDGSYSTSSFPFNNSDCAESMSLGFFYVENPTLYSEYYMSYNCVLEALGSDESGDNAYCNGQDKSGHYNCSWFNGINEPEILHAYKD